MNKVSRSVLEQRAAKSMEFLPGYRWATDHGEFICPECEAPGTLTLLDPMEQRVDLRCSGGCSSLDVIRRAESARDAAAYKKIGPRPGLISADHANDPNGGSWRDRFSEGQTRWLIPGLWPWGHMPLLTGQPKAGKTTVVVDLVASLLVPERSFLGHFEPSCLNEDDRNRGIVLINAETPPGDLVAELVSTVGEHPNGDLLDVFHLEERGGAATFDLTDPSIFDQWAHNLTWCESCDRSDDWTPSVVIVDGLTAILAAAGKGVEHYGLWYAQFRLLMTELQVPNALVVGHSTMTGNHSMGGTEALAGPDGLWTYASDDLNNPRAGRRFAVTPRMGGAVVPSLRVVRGEDGRLSAPADDKPVSDDGQEAGQSSPDAEAEEHVRDVLTRAGALGMRKTEITKSGRYAQPKREALARMVDRGDLVMKPEGQGFRYWLAEAVSS